MSASSARHKPLLPTLTRSTAWSTDKIAALGLAEIRALSANAERLGEEEVVALCKEAISVRAKKQSALRKLVKKPAVKKIKPVVKVEA
jgi:hypothetical protein